MSVPTAILLQAHRVTPALRTLLTALRAACPPPDAVWLLYDNSRADLDTATRAEGPCWLFDTAEIWRRYRLAPCLPDGPTNCLIPGNFIFPILDFMRAHPEFAYAWRLEYDVRFSGDWRAFFAGLADRDADLLGTTLYRHPERPAWPWWGSLSTAAEPVPLAERVRGFFPVIRLSRPAMRHLLDAHHAGWRGHDEVFIPTALAHRGLTLEDIGGTGAFVRPGDANRFYTNSPSRDGLWPGTFVYRHPPGAMVGLPDDGTLLAGKLYHPVKDPGD